MSTSGFFVQFISKSLGLVGDTGGSNDEPQPGGPCSIVEIEAQSLVILPAQTICLQVGFYVQFISKSLGLVGDSGGKNDEPQPTWRPMFHC